MAHLLIYCATTISKRHQFFTDKLILQACNNIQSMQGSNSRGVHGTGGSGICKYPDPFQMFGILKFKIRSQIHKKKSPFRFVPIFRDKMVRFSVLVEISNRTRRNGYSDKNIKTLKKKLFMKSLATISITRL